MKIAIFGEKFSDNLGDGVISDCVAHAFSRNNSEFSVSTHDLSMREDFSFSISERSDIKNSVVSVFFRRIKKLLGWEFFRLLKFKQKYESVISESNLVLIGGGQIFLDNELNFPVKLRALTKILNKHKVKHAFVCCGVSKNMSLIGSAIFKAVVKSPFVISLIVRDVNSVQNAKNVLGYSNPKFLLDPAIISADVYVKTMVFPSFEGKTIGLNVMDFTTLEKCFNAEISRNNFLKVWQGLIELLLKDGYRIVLHTNGAAEDNYSLKILTDSINSSRNIIVTTPRNPSELANIIANLDVLVAYRLHANILAYALEVPSIGIVWDDKVSEFASITERNEFFVSGGSIDSALFHEQIKKALLTPIDRTKLLSLKNTFYNGVTDFIKNSDM